MKTRPHILHLTRRKYLAEVLWLRSFDFKINLFFSDPQRLHFILKLPVFPPC